MSFGVDSRAWLARWKHFFWLLSLWTTINGDISSSSTINVSEGVTAQISCIHGVSSSDLNLWYKQIPGTAPWVVIYGYSNTDKKERLWMTVDKAKKSTELFISKVEMADAGVYYCAASGSGTRMVFGKGTVLSVEPDLPPSEPFVYELKPHDESKSLSACLFADYSPDNIEVSVGGEPKDTNSSVVVVGSEASYGAVRWTKNTGNLNCTATYDGKKFFANNNATADVCSGTPMSFQTDERLNLLSLTVLGLRIIFLKSVAVNLLLTFRLWYIKN